MLNGGVAPGGFLMAVAEHPWPPTSGGRLRPAGIAAALADLGPTVVVSLDMPQPPPQLEASLRRYWARRRNQPLRLLDLATGVVLGNHVALQRAIAAGLPAAFEALVRELRPGVVILGRPFFGPFVSVARVDDSLRGQDASGLPLAALLASLALAGARRRR